MKHLLLSLVLVLSLSPIAASAFSLDEYETMTRVAQRYVAGELDQRMIELGQNFQTKEFNVTVGRTQKRGVEAYCAFYARFGKSKLNGSCSRTIQAPTGSGTFVSF